MRNSLTKKVQGSVSLRAMAKFPVIQLRKVHAVNYNGDICVGCELVRAHDRGN